MRRHPYALLAPAGLIGAVVDVMELVKDDPVAYVALALMVAVAFELYVGYVERLLIEVETGVRRIAILSVGRKALPLVPALFAASLLAVTLPLAATGLLVVPGLWLATRWSLFAPAISKERLRALEGIRRSNRLVRGRFWPVFATATLSLLVEHGVIHTAAQGAEPLTDSRAIALIATALVVAAVSAVAAVTISLVYERLATRFSE